MKEECISRLYCLSIINMEVDLGKLPMRRLLLTFGALLFFSSIGFSQRKAKVTVLTNTKEIGKNMVTQEPIRATEYILPERIHSFEFDTLTNDLTLQLRKLRNEKWLGNKGNVIRYDLNTNKVKWVKKITYQLESIQQYGGITIHSSAGKSYCIDSETAEQRWKVKNTLAFADPIEQVGVGYKIQAAKKAENLLEGISLKDGSVLWQRYLNREYSWNNVFYINDTTLLVAAAGLHTVNINDGSGWDYTTVTGKKDYTASAIGTGLGIAAGLLTGTYAMATGHNLVRDVVSNVLIDSSSIFLASKENIVKLDREGEVVWLVSLPDDLTSKSVIYKNDTSLIMINLGYAFMGYRQLDFGTPFIASFNLHTGKQQYLKLLSDEKKEAMADYSITDDTLFVIFNNRIAKYFPEDGRLIDEEVLDTDIYGELKYFVGDHVFTENGSTFSSLPNQDSTKQYLFTDKQKILVLNTKFKVVDEVRFEDLYIHYLRKNDLRFIAKDNQTLVLDSSGQRVAAFSASRQSTLVNNKLYSVEGARLLEIKLDNLWDPK